jgi:hypothetical protein
MDLATNFNITSTIPVPRALLLVMNSAATKLLVFSENYTSVCTGTSRAGTSALSVFDIATNTVTPVCGFDQPVWGAFSSDGNTAYIMNCGPECGGTAASVQMLDMTQVAVTTTVNTTAAATTTVPVPGATIGLLKGTSLYVAGTQYVAGKAGQGMLSVLDLSSGSPTAAAPVTIGDGLHTLMSLATNNKLYIGASGCTGGTGCLSIFDTSANTAVVSTASGPVTGMVPVPNRNLVYVCEGSPGAVHIYFPTSSTANFDTSIDIVGDAVQIVTVDESAGTTVGVPLSTLP